MALSLGDFYGKRPARRDMNLSHSSSYQPNESLTQRRDLQVQFSDDELETQFDSFTSSMSGVTSTPENDHRNRSRTAERHTARSLPLSSSQPTVPSEVVGMLQEQQGLLQKILHEQQEMNKAVKKNDTRIRVIEETLKKYSDSSTSCSSSGEKKRYVTKDLTVSTFIYM